MLAILLGLLGILIFSKPVFAGESPTQLGPAYGSTVTLSKLEWQAPTYPLYSNGSPYLVVVDNDQDFSSPEKNSVYLTNNYYSPKLDLGTWYWRVRAKDLDGNWSEWSPAWSFTLSDSTPIPSSQLSPTNNPIPTPTSIPNSTATSIPSDFSISGVPTQINSDQSFIVSINLSIPGKANTDYYLSGVFKSVDGTRYFGLTKTDLEWKQYSSDKGNRYKITTDSSGIWTGNLQVKPDAKDSDYKGSGDYIFKVGRYTSSGSGPTWSNEVSLKIIGDKNEQQETTNNSEKEVSEGSVLGEEIFDNASIIEVKSASYTPNINYQIASSSVAGETSPQMVESFKDKGPNLFLLSGLGFIILGGGIFSYTYFFKIKKFKKINL